MDEPTDREMSMSKALPALSLRSLLLAASASLALAAFVPNPVHAAPPDSEGHELTTDSPELAADRARALQRVEQDRDAALQQQEAQQRREDAAAATEQAATAQATTRTVNPLSGSTAAPDYVPPPGTSGSSEPAPLLNDRANAETERSGSSAASATNWSDEGKDIARSGSTAGPGPAASDDAASASAGAPLSRVPAPGTTPGENAADPVTAPDIAGEGGASVVPESERVDR
jgi:hypothetical protein